jgi:hypothetical protein
MVDLYLYVPFPFPRAYVMQSYWGQISTSPPPPPPSRSWKLRVFRSYEKKKEDIIEGGGGRVVGGYKSYCSQNIPQFCP